MDDADVICMDVEEMSAIPVNEMVSVVVPSY